MTIGVNFDKFISLYAGSSDPSQHRSFRGLPQQNAEDDCRHRPVRTVSRLMSFNRSLQYITWLKYCRYGVKLFPINQSNMIYYRHILNIDLFKNIQRIVFLQKHSNKANKSQQNLWFIDIFKKNFHILIEPWMHYTNINHGCNIRDTNYKL